MKYFIIGLHASGKQEVADILEKNGVRCGKLFSNIDKPDEQVYNSYNYELFTMKDINGVFENNAYVFIQELQSSANVNSFKFYEGLSKYNFENNDVFILSPDQLINISPNTIKEPICFVWLDNTKSNRASRYYNEKRSYNFIERDNIEKRDIDIFVKTIYTFNNSPVLYFSNEEPGRVAAIVNAVITHPDLLDIFTEYYN